MAMAPADQNSAGIAPEMAADPRVIRIVTGKQESNDAEVRDGLDGLAQAGCPGVSLQSASLSVQEGGDIVVPSGMDHAGDFVASFTLDLHFADGKEKRVGDATLLVGRHEKANGTSNAAASLDLSMDWEQSAAQGLAERLLAASSAAAKRWGMPLQVTREASRQLVAHGMDLPRAAGGAVQVANRAVIRHDFAPTHEQREVRCSSQELRADIAAKIVKGEVYPPFSPDSDHEYDVAEVQRHVDTWGTFVRPKTLEKLAQDYLQFYRNVDKMHDRTTRAGDPVESFIAPADSKDNTPGSWVMAVKVSDAVWPMVEQRKLTGFSIDVLARRVPTWVRVKGEGKLPDLSGAVGPGVPPREAVVRGSAILRMDELVDIQPNFVSLVDRAANRRSFEMRSAAGAQAAEPEHLVIKVEKSELPEIRKAMDSNPGLARITPPPAGAVVISISAPQGTQVQVQRGEFDESLHPRGPDGKFGSGGGLSEKHSNALKAIGEAGARPDMARLAKQHGADTINDLVESGHAALKQGRFGMQVHPTEKGQSAIAERHAADHPPVKTGTTSVEIPPAKRGWPDAGKAAKEIFGAKADLKKIASETIKVPEGHTASVKVTADGPGSIHMAATIKGPDGHEVGQIGVSITSDRPLRSAEVATATASLRPSSPASEKTDPADHVTTMQIDRLDTAVKAGPGGEAMAKSLMTGLLSSARDNGVNQIVATDLTGPASYALARIGFGSEYSGHAPGLRDHLVEKAGLDMRAADKIVSKLRSAADVAALKIGDKQVGKDFLTSGRGSWDGTLEVGEGQVKEFGHSDHDWGTAKRVLGV